jgi:hypothetical protein
MQRPYITLPGPPSEFENAGELSDWEVVDCDTGSPLSSPRQIEARNDALRVYWETFEQVDGNPNDPALKTAFRWLRFLCDRATHHFVYRERWEATEEQHATIITKCQYCGAVPPLITEAGWSLKVALLCDKPERHDFANPLSRRWPIEDMPVPIARTYIPNA